MKSNEYKLRDIIQLVWTYSGNNNPSIFVLNDETDDSNKAFCPTCIFIDDDGDVIIQIDKTKL